MQNIWYRVFNYAKKVHSVWKLFLTWKTSLVIFNHYELYFQTLKKKQKRLNYSNEKEKLQSEYNLGWDVSDLILMTCFAIYGQKIHCGS